MLEKAIRQELEDVFTKEKLEEYTKEQTDLMLTVLDEKWVSFTREMLTEDDLMNITIKTDNISDVLWSAYHNVVSLLCMLQAIKETDCKIIRMLPVFNAMSKDINYLIQVISTFKTVKLNQNIINIIGSLMNRIEGFNKQQLAWLLAYQDHLTDNSKTFLANLVDMIKSELYHLNFYAPKEVSREKYLYTLYNETTRNTKKVENIIQHLVQLHSNVETIQTEKKLYIENNSQFIQSILDNHYDMRLRYRLEPEGKMIKLGQEFRVRQQSLLNQIQERYTEYHTFLEKNVKNFQKISGVKFKKETNCLNWIQKYDTEATARQVVLDDLHEQEAKWQEQIKLYKQKSLDQNEAWCIYMDAKREDTRIALRIKVINRAATRIQKWWRKLWKKLLKTRKKEKKRLARLKKKKGF